MKQAVDVGCAAFQTAIKVLGRPWTAAILGLLHGGPLRYSEIAQRVEGVGDKILSARLRELERQGIVRRNVDRGRPVRVSYSLTNRGDAFRRVAEAIQRWGQELVRPASGHRAKRRR
jgi:DNA-binding HxlR family transcriptional regulator